MALKQAVYDVFVRFRINAKSWDKSLKRVSRQLDRTAKKFTNAGRSLTTGLTAPLALADGAAVKFAVDLEQSFAKIQNLVGISAKSLRGFTNEVRRISDQTGSAQKKIADGLFFVTSAGFRGATAIDILEASTKAAAIGLGEIAVVADATTSILNAYGKVLLSNTSYES